MTNRTNVSLMLSLCVAGGLSTGCDEFTEPTEQLAAPGSDFELAAWPPLPPAQAANAEFDLTAAPASVAKNPSPKEKLVIGWMRWAMALPWLDGPINDSTGEHCALGQDGPVWFLAGTSGGTVTRECDIPNGKQLFFPLINRWYAFFPEYYPTDESVAAILPEAVAYFTDTYTAPCSLTLRIDGEEVVPGLDTLDEETFIQAFEPFEVVLNDENYGSPYGLSSGSMKAISWGNYARIQPLTPGDHVLELGGIRCAPYFQTAVTYYLHVGD